MPAPTRDIKPKYDQTAENFVTKVVSSLVLEDPFYGYLLLRMDITQDPAIPTACTNGKWIKYNPTFVRNLSIPKAKGLFKHEIMHIAGLHHLRRGQREPRRWGMAADYVINAHLMSAKVPLPDCGLMDPKYVDYSAESAYNDLPELPENDSWDWGGVTDADGIEDESVLTQLEEDTRLEVIQAVNVAKLMGKIPAGLERYIDDIKQSKMPWKLILARFFAAQAKDDASWKRPNRRYLPLDIILPSPFSIRMGPLVVAVDTSGSIGQEELNNFISAINGMLKQTRPEYVLVIYCDAAVGNVQKFTPRDLPLKAADFKPSGGGGTSFIPPFNYLEERNIKPCAFIYLTDMCGVFPETPPKYPVIWCATTKVQAPWGRTLELK